jgi:two-component system chemotaxis response regulator CheY
MGYQALIVDDSPIIRSMVAKTLRISGLNIEGVYFAANGQEALEELQQRQIDIVFSDINMPVMDGVEMVDGMAAQGLLDRVPVVIISTERSSQRFQALKSRGVWAYLEKPFAPEQLRTVVNQLLEQRGRT